MFAPESLCILQWHVVAYNSDESSVYKRLPRSGTRVPGSKFRSIKQNIWNNLPFACWFCIVCVNWFTKAMQR